MDVDSRTSLNTKGRVIMYYIGIDVGKFKHCACVVDSNGEVLVKPFFFTNDHAGFDLFLNNTSQFKSSRHIVGLEATGHYGDNLVNFLISNDYEVGLINPLTTDAKRRGKIRKTKNDKKDTFLICSVLFDKNYTRVTKRKLDLKQAKELTRYHATLTEDLNQNKNRLQKCIDIVIPEINVWFKTKYSRAYMAILKEFGNSYNLANANLTHLKNILKPKGRGKHADVDAVSLREAAKQSIGENNEVITMEIGMLIEAIELIKSQLSIVDKKIEELATTLNSPIFTVPGIGTYSGMSILSEIGDIDNFSSAAKVIGFAGVDPGTYQSGEYKAPQTALSKRGSRYLRKTLYQCILTVCSNNPTFNSYYNLKRSQGKSHRCAQGHSVRKLIRVIYKLLSENIPFDETALI